MKAYTIVFDKKHKNKIVLVVQRNNNKNVRQAVILDGFLLYAHTYY